MPQTKIQITSYPIRLGQFLKLADITSDGIEAKTLIAGGEVLVNNLIETRRGRQLAQGDTILVYGQEFLCA
jgi:ribosome-associated protein